MKKSEANAHGVKLLSSFQMIEAMAVIKIVSVFRPFIFQPKLQKNKGVLG